MVSIIQNRLTLQAQLVNTAIEQLGLTLGLSSNHDTERVRCLMLLFYVIMPIFTAFTRSEIATLISIATGIQYSHQLIRTPFEEAQLYLFRAQQQANVAVVVAPA
jgi:hypothetical protein